MTGGWDRRDSGAHAVHVFSRPLRVVVLRASEDTTGRPALARAARLARPGVVELLVQPAPPGLGLARWVPRNRVRLFTADRPDGVLDGPPQLDGALDGGEP